MIAACHVRGDVPALREDLARLVPDARHVIVRYSRHHIHQDRSELVIDAIERVVAKVREPGSWTTGLATSRRDREGAQGSPDSGAGLP